MARLIFAQIITTLFCVSAYAQESIAEYQLKIVENYIEAFNLHDLDAMMDMVADNVQWLTIEGDEIIKEANSKEELRATMTKYFEDCVGCRSSLKHIYATGQRVMALEVASFPTGHGTLSQQSASVYEFVGPRIRRVYYFPVEN